MEIHNSFILKLLYSYQQIWNKTFQVHQFRKSENGNIFYFSNTKPIDGDFVSLASFMAYFRGIMIMWKGAIWGNSA